MGKKKGGRQSKFSQGKISEDLGSAYDDGYKTILDPNSRDNVYDEVDQYHDDISATNLSEAVKRMKVKKARKEKVLSLGMDSSDEEAVPEEEEESEDSDDSDDDEEAEHESEEESDEEQGNEGLRPFLETDDIIEKKEDELPDERAWGKDKSLYYGTNVTDQIIRKRATHQHISEVYDATTRELEANKAYQQRMQDNLKGLNFMELLELEDELEEEEGEEMKSDKESKKTKSKKEKSKKKKSETEKQSTEDLSWTFKPDQKNVSNEERVKLLKQLSPEYLPLCRDLKSKLEDMVNLLEPILKLHKEGVLPDCPAYLYVKTKYLLSNQYSMMVFCYMMLIRKIGHGAIKTHPVMERLARHRFLFKQLERADGIVLPQLKVILDRVQHNIPLNLKPDKAKQSTEAAGEASTIGKIRKLSILKKKKSSDVSNTDEPPAKKVKLVTAVESDSGGDDDDDGNAANKNTTEGDSRRHIGKMITKNRGLTPHRKKELKNPRIKYKTKYSQKLKRRKGQVREASKEIPLYVGEKTGINKYAIKSRKM